MLKLDRRTLLAGLSLGVVSPGLLARAADKPSAPAPALRLGPAKPFSFDSLRARAKKSATQPYKAAIPRATAIIEAIDFDTTQKIKFRSDHALWRGEQKTYPVSFFHLNMYAHDPVVVHEVENGAARQILYGPDYFDYSATKIDTGRLKDLGFAGFRVMDNQTAPTDWLAFQGASYFRSSGQDDQYGASARGIAVNTALATAEEFPRFTEFWLAEQGNVIVIHALLEGPSLAGAYRFEASKSDSVTMNVHCDLFFRANITRLGVAPLTSMYWYGENERRKAVDWRPEIHDSDGLALWTGKGERIWRPLINPPAVQTNFFVDNNPKGFGLMQRDRNFPDYEDDGAFYNRRPGLWVEPRGSWGPGAVQLVEIPTDDEVHDNIVAYWRPDRDIASGDNLSFDYRLSFIDAEPNFPKTLARCVGTRIGRGGIPGSNNAPANKRKFVIDFHGGALDKLEQRYDIVPMVTPSRGKIEGAYVVKVVGTDRWRALFDLDVSGREAVDLRCYLRLGDKTLTETWLYQYFP